jgi:nicotinate-nucleotide pyrophosphorylase (carboxylating)
LPIEVEVESIAELDEALSVGANRLLLDNFDIADLQAAVDINQEKGRPPAKLKASSGITLDTIRAIAETGVDYISIGAMTKDVSAVDLSMPFHYDD